MAVINSKDRKLPKHDQFCKLLGKMLLDDQTTDTKKQLAAEFSTFAEGITPPESILETYGVQGTFKVVNDIMNLDITVPEEFVPLAYKGDKKDAHVKFVVAYRATK